MLRGCKPRVILAHVIGAEQRPIEDIKQRGFAETVDPNNYVDALAERVLNARRTRILKQAITANRELAEHREADRQVTIPLNPIRDAEA